MPGGTAGCVECTCILETEAFVKRQLEILELGFQEVTPVRSSRDRGVPRQLGLYG
jgi:hypothetical protein